MSIYKTWLLARLKQSSEASTTASKYKPEVNGLRALAVLAVVLFHAQFRFAEVTLFQGGFFGVDIFFVISGYLITGQLLLQIKERRFNPLLFIEKRTRRIVPALIFVLLAITPLTFLFLSPGDLVAYEKLKLLAVFFVSNVWFSFTNAYWATSSLQIPLLHTWSLSVEMQFYSIACVLALITRWSGGQPKPWLFVLGVLLIASCLASMILYAYNPRFAFYWLPARFWEFTVGSLVAYITIHRFPDLRSRLPRMLCVALPKCGLLMVVLSFVIIDENSAAPYLINWLPVLGTATLLLFFDSDELITRWLRNRILVFIGASSYSLYLWHYPLFAFARLSSPDLTVMVKVGLIVLSLLLATLTYLAIERYFHRHSSRRAYYTFSIGLMLCLAVYALAVLQTQGFGQQRFGALYADNTDLIPGTPECAFIPSIDPTYPICNGCEFEKHSHDLSRRLILVGDSHAESFSLMLRRYANQQGWLFFKATTPGCLYIEGITRNLEELKRGTFCVQGENLPQKFNRWLSETEHQYSQTFIVWSGRMVAHLEGPFVNREGLKEYWPLANKPYVPMSGYDGGFETLFRRQMGFFINHSDRLVIIYPIPELGWHFPKLLPFSMLAPNTDSLSFLHSKYNSYEQFRNRSAYTRSLLDSLSASTLRRIYPERSLCASARNQCVGIIGTQMLYWDDDHLSRHGVKLIEPDLLNALVVE